MKRFFNITVNGTQYSVEVEETAGGQADTAAPVQTAAPAPKAAPKAAAPAPAAKPAVNAAGTKVSSPMQGTIVKVSFKEGDKVKKGDVVCLLEAMKMENEIFAPCDGTVVSLQTRQGAAVNTGDVLLVIG